MLLIGSYVMGICSQLLILEPCDIVGSSVHWWRYQRFEGAHSVYNLLGATYFSVWFGLLLFRTSCSSLYDLARESMVFQQLTIKSLPRRKLQNQINSFNIFIKCAEACPISATQ